MARYLIYSTGTTYSGTILRESAISGTTSGGTSEYYSNFIIPEIQPLYLWQVTPLVNPNDVIPNTETKINNYELATGPAPTAQDLATYGELTGMTSTKIEKVLGQTDKVPVFTSGGGLQSSGYSIPQLTGLTTYTFEGSGGTVVITQGNHIIIDSTPASGTTVAWGDIYGTISNQPDLWHILTGTTATTATKLAISTFQGYTGTTAPNAFAKKSDAFTGVTTSGTGSTLINNTNDRVATLKSLSTRGGVKITTTSTDIIISGETNVTPAWGSITGTLSSQTDLWNVLTGTTAATANKISKVTGAANTIPAFTVDGSLSGSSKQFTTTVRGTGQATNSYVPTEQAVRNAITQSITAAVILQGDWNALTNTPDLTSGGTGSGYTTGYAWRVSVSGATALGGLTPWRVGDMAIKVAAAPGWVHVNSEDIAALWGNIGGTLSNQTDLWTELTGMTASIATKLNTSIYQYYTGTTAPATFAKKADAITGATNLGSGNGTICAGISGNKIELKTLSGGTNVTLTTNGNYIGINVVNDTDLVWTGSTANGIGTYVDSTHICSQPNLTFDGSSLSVTGNVKASTCVVSPLISGGTLCATTSAIVPTPTADNNSTCVATTGWYFGQSGNTAPVMDGSPTVGVSPKWAHQDHVHPSDTSKLNVTVFDGYTASTVNKDKKIQVVSISTLNVNVVTPTGVTWNSASPFATDIYGWTGTTVKIKSAGTYEVQYHVVLKNDTANQTHSIGGYIVKNGSTTLTNTATAGMVVGISGSGELSLPPVVQTFALNDKLVLALFRIGGTGTVNLVANSVTLTLNKLT